MSTATEKRYDLLVVGGGPAGLAAASTAAGLGLDVALVDERPTFGGQIYKQPGPGFVVKDPRALGRDHLRGRELIEQAEASGAELLPSTSAVAVRDDDVVLVPEGGHARTVSAARLLVAPGAHDRPVVFPGWTLPGVLTAGAAQTIVKTQRVLPGERLVFAGSGPLALAFPAQLRHYGANVLLALEAGPRPGSATSSGSAPQRGATARLLRDAVSYRVGAPPRPRADALRPDRRSRRGRRQGRARRPRSGRPRLARDPRHRGDGRGGHALRGLRVRSLASSCCGSPAATSGTTRTSAGRSSSWTSGADDGAGRLRRR